MIRILFVLFLGSLTCCARATTPPPDIVADEKTACDEMAAVGCVVKTTCAQTITKINADTQHFEHIDIVCLANAKTPNDVTRCGVSCTLEAGTDQ